jgi:hypothetical protein
MHVQCRCIETRKYRQRNQVINNNSYNLCFMVCWADCLGNCGTKQSREHVISESLWLANSVTVQGFPWCADEPRNIGVASLTAKILCERHNNNLSPVDSSAAKSFDELRKMTRLKNVREGMKAHRWNVKRYVLDGVMLERWFLKTLINIAFDGKYPIGSDSTAPGRPSERLVRVTHGLESFQGKAGMYTMARVGMEYILEDRVSFSPIMWRGIHGEYVVAGIFVFRGFQFLLYLEPEGPQHMRRLYFKGEHLGEASLLYQKMTANIKIGKYLSHVVRIVRTS